MKLLSSLQNRMFLASALVAVVSVAFAIRFVTARVAREAEADLRRGLEQSAALVERHHAARQDVRLLVARLVADLPVLKAAVATGDSPTVRPVAEDYRKLTDADYLAVTDRGGRVLALLGADPPDPAAVSRALAGREAVTFRAGHDGLLQVISLPIVVGPRDTAEMLGTLSLGFALDAQLVAEYRDVTQSEVAFVFDGRLAASSVAGLAAADADRAAGARTPVTLHVAADEYLALSRSLSAAQAQGPAPVALILRSRTARLAVLRTFRTAMWAAAIVAVVVAIALSYAVARTVTRPLTALTAAMRDVATTGDLTRKIRLSPGWYDEDARLLTQSFNALTDSIARFQREAALKDRLSALGRLSTVIAHEIRNPLMIIKASLRSLRSQNLSADDLRETAADIDHEIARLDRTVADVLDFARPVRLELGATDLNAVCRDAVAVATLGRPAADCRLELDPAQPTLRSDAERLRTVLVNLLSNARQSVEGRERPDAEPAVSLTTAARPDGGASVIVADHGGGIDAADLPHIFDPYFTTKRTGTGLGLAIAKNIVDSLGGRLEAVSRPGEGTQIRLELPAAPPASEAAR